MIFDKSFKPREPTTKMADSGAGTQMSLAQLVDFLGLQGYTGKALSEATYFTCLRVLSESMGKLPLKLVQKTSDNGTIQRTDHPLYDVLRIRPNPYVTSTSFNSSLETARNHFGNAYAWIQPWGATVRLWQLPSNQVTVWWDNGKILSEVPHIWYIWNAPNGKQYAFSEEEMLHFPSWYSPDGVCGLPVRDILKLTIDGSIKSQAMLNKMYENGMTGKAVLQYTGDLNDEKTRAYVAGIENYVNGTVTGKEQLIPLPLGSTITPLDIKLADSQFIELRKHSALSIAAAFGVKPDQINDYSKSSYSSSEAQQLGFLVDALLWRIGNNEEEYSYKLLRPEERAQGLTPEYNTGVILRADMKTQIDSLTAAVAGSVYTPNEARNYLGQSSKPGGDKLYFSNGSAIPLEMAGSQYCEKGEKTTNE